MRSDAGSRGDAIVFKRGPLPSVGETFFESRSIHRLSNGRIIHERRLRFMLRGAISHPRSLLGFQMEGRINRGGNVGKYFQFFVLSHKDVPYIIHIFLHAHKYLHPVFYTYFIHIILHSLFTHKSACTGIETTIPFDFRVYILNIIYPTLLFLCTGKHLHDYQLYMQAINYEIECNSSECMHVIKKTTLYPTFCIHMKMKSIYFL